MSRSSEQESPVLVVREVRREFKVRGARMLALDGVSFTVEAGRTLAVIGESGAGKTTLSRIVCGLDRPTSGEVAIGGRPVRVRSGSPSPVQMVFQSPFDALSPYISIGRSVAEPLRGMARRERGERTAELLSMVGIDPKRADDRPRRFSGGQLQRVVLARALAAAPRVLLCDEPTSALDVSVQAQIVNLLLDLQQEQGFACVLVTHDLPVARVLADDVLVLRHGRALEMGPADAFFAAPSSDYGRSLLEAAV